MSIATRIPALRDLSGDGVPLLRWLIFTGVTVFGFVLAWHYGLFHLMLASDKTYISAIICLFYVVTCVHCFLRTAAISHELDNAQRVYALVSSGSAGFRISGDDVVMAEGAILPPGQVTTHIRNLVLKSRLQGHGHLDQTLLLRGFADALRGASQFGSFASDAMMKLGLLGTIIGFIIMLAPIAGLDAADKVAMKSSMGLMSDGMAVAMYTTLAGLVGSILVRIQYYMLDAATQRVFSDTVTLTETRVTPVLERRHDG